MNLDYKVRFAEFEQKYLSGDRLELDQNGRTELDNLLAFNGFERRGCPCQGYQYLRVDGKTPSFELLVTGDPFDLSNKRGDTQYTFVSAPG